MMTLILDLQFDRRWQRLHDPNFVCRGCGQKHGGLIELNIEKPLLWQGGDMQDASSPDVDPRNHLFEDFCVIDNKQFFIRAIVELPILGSASANKPVSKQYFSAWVSLSATDYDRYGDSLIEPNQTIAEPFKGKFANRVATFPDALDLPVIVLPQKGDLRPLIYFEESDHPLVQAQRHGLSFEALLSFYAACGHDIRSGLSIVN